MIHICNPKTQITETGDSVQGQPGLRSKFQASQGSIVRPGLKNTKTTRQWPHNFSLSTQEAGQWIFDFEASLVYKG